jgi:diaminopimelate dehydrogenase
LTCINEQGGQRIEHAWDRTGEREMARPRIAVVGLGRLGVRCAEAIESSDDLALAGIVRRPESLGRRLPPALAGATVAAHLSELGQPDAALLCTPPETIVEAVRHALHNGVSVVECSASETTAMRAHRDELARLAMRHKCVAVLGAGWDPGAVTLFRTLFAILEPKGHTTAIDRPGVSLHHSATARAVPGVRDALATEVRGAAGTLQRYVYVEFEPGADTPRVVDEIRADPAFAADETFVFPVSDLKRMEDEGHGIVLERRGVAANVAHQRLLLEARFDRAAMAAAMMLSAARAVPRLSPGAYTLLDVPLRALYGTRPPEGETRP